MKCTKCGLEKPNYHFIAFTGIYQKEFFANPTALNSQCWDCNSPYKCIICNEVKEASEFRVGGRVCRMCKDDKMPTQNRPSRSKERRL